MMRPVINQLLRPVKALQKIVVSLCATQLIISELPQLNVLYSTLSEKPPTSDKSPNLFSLPDRYWLFVRVYVNSVVITSSPSTTSCRVKTKWSWSIIRTVS